MGLLSPSKAKLYDTKRLLDANATCLTAGQGKGENYVQNNVLFWLSENVFKSSQNTI